ncbi:MAG TPA: hypothetical protein PKK06_15655 [Phycisphaerae bacterium]|nr:hypothetical protein [Phycisphaerae bacterium]HNU46765.1 hypothetical protein [Phycisphaerae bacterium]
MNIRFVILLVFLVFLVVVVVVMKTDRQQTQTGIVDESMNDDVMTPAEREKLEAAQKMLQDLPLPGEEPTVRPEFHVEVRVDTSDGKNRLWMVITEAHGYFAETFRLAFWKKGYEQHRWDHFVNDYLKARGTLVVESFVVPAELLRVGGDMGQTGDWEAEVVEHGRVRAETPPNWPPHAPHD